MVDARLKKYLVNTVRVLCILPLIYLIVLGIILGSVMLVSGNQEDRIYVLVVFLLIMWCFFLFALLKRLAKSVKIKKKNETGKKRSYFNLLIPVFICILIFLAAFYSKDFRNTFLYSTNRAAIFIVLTVLFAILLFLSAVKQIHFRWALMLFIFLICFSFVGIAIDRFTDDEPKNNILLQTAGEIK